MAYATWNEVADAVDGEARLKSLLLPHADTADDHPFFDDQAKVADAIVDAELRRAGYIVPLEGPPLADAALRRAWIGILVGVLTESASNREPWMEKLEAWGYGYVKRIGDGDVTVAGAELETDTGTLTAEFYSHVVDDPVFDIGDPRATVTQVFPPLGGPYRSRG